VFSLSFEVPARPHPPSNSPLPCRYTRSSVYCSFCKIQFNIIRPYKHSSPKWGPTFRVTLPDTSRIFTSPPYVPHAQLIRSSSTSSPLATTGNRTTPWTFFKQYRDRWKHHVQQPLPLTETSLVFTPSKLLGTLEHLLKLSGEF
jgi:hypothetical protein